MIFVRVPYFAGRRQRKELRAPPSSSRRAGWRRLARPYGSQFPNRQTNSRLPGPKQRAQTARLGKFFRFNSSLKRGISLLRRGARCRSAPAPDLPVAKTVSVRALADIGETTLRCFANILLQQSRAVELSRRAGTALTPGGRCLPALGRGLTAEKNGLRQP